MSILELVARTFAPPLPDGRFVFRPWGARGPCYLLTARQRAGRAWLQLALYLMMLASFWFVPELALTWDGILVFFVAFVALNRLLYALFSIGLPKTDKPAPLSAEQRRAALASHSRGIGRPVLWIFLILCWVLILGGVLVVATGDTLSGLLCILFFGACAATFTRQLRLIRKAPGA
jgi:hypothetical protein